MFWVPSVGTLGLGLSILSYAGEVRVAVTADRAVCDNPQLLLDDFRDEFERMSSLPDAPAAAAADSSNGKPKSR